ncbi:MAG TPA: nicotinate-nucleotide adenylyltransferase [Methylomirabilota bacterium]|nr:nicotinate-nucleotide adenylyltransferase [Methylomirabilota bacterium]
MRIGIFGGAFNPIHYGHLLLADEVSERLQCDRFVFVPAARPPHKPETELAPASDRDAMVRAAITDHPTFEVSSIEIERPGISYSVETVGTFAKQFGRGSSLFFLIGGETFLELPSWRDPGRLAELATFIVVPRHGSPFDPESPAALKVLALLGNRRWSVVPDEGPPAAMQKDCVLLMRATSLPISASDLRRRAREGRSLRFRVPPAVEAYIRLHGLYRSRAECR